MDCPACQPAVGFNHKTELRQHLTDSHHMDYPVALSIANLLERVEKLEKQTDLDKPE
jgi:hypothetical protein